MPIENFFTYAILRAALFSAASPAECLRSAGSLAIIGDLKLNYTTGPTDNAISNLIIKKWFQNS